MNLTGQQIAQIREALLAAFPTRDSLRMLVRIELDANLDVVAGGGNLRVVVFNLLTWAESIGQVARLIKGAVRENPGNPALAQLVTASRSWPELALVATDESAQSPLSETPTIIDIFLSYNRKDAVIMRRLHADLRNAGFSVWIDEGLEAGTPNWKVAVEEAVHQARCMVVVMTPNAKASDWVNIEVSLARALGKDVFPVLADGDKLTATIFDLLTTQHVDIRRSYSQGVNQELLPSLNRLLMPKHQVETVSSELETMTPVIDFGWVTIPAGEFLMGSDKAKDHMAYGREMPEHKLILPEYRIARVPVTVAQFARFVEATGYITSAEESNGGWVWTDSKWQQIEGAYWAHPSGPNSDVRDKQDHPVTQVSWHDALVFCNWAEVRLPSEAEWEKAARGTDSRIWPWGNELPTERHCNFNKNIGETTPVGSYSGATSPFGLFDVAGNVWEWTSTLFHVYPYDAGDGREDRNAGGRRALRGGSWGNTESNVRCAIRSISLPHFSYIYNSFRVAAPRR